MRAKYFDIFLLIFSFAIVFSDISWDMFQGSVVTVNDGIALLLLLFSVRLVIHNSTFGQYGLLVLLLIGLTNVVELKYQIGNTTYSSHSFVRMGAIEFNPGSFFLLLLYCLINRRELVRHVVKIRFVSDEERADKQAKMFDFYYRQFTTCTEEELKRAFGLFTSYPIEAQMALKKIQEEIDLRTI